MPADPSPPRLTVTLVCADLDRARAFYTAVLGELGLALSAEFGDEEQDGAPVEAVAFELPGSAALWLLSGTPPTTGAHLAVPGCAPDVVRRAYAAGLAHGGTARRAPRRWTVYATGRFVAQLVDPGGNVLELVTDEV